MQALCSAICNQKGKGVQYSEPVESSMPKLLISMEKKKRFSGRLVEKVRCQGQPSSARAQPYATIKFL